MKVYMAAQYARRDELREYRKQLEAIGIEVTSRWLNENEPLNSKMGQHSTEFYIETATYDLEDIDKAEGIVFFSEDPLVGIPRGGRHVEFGYALKGEKLIFVVGPKENVFHYPIYDYRIIHFDKFDQLVKWLSVTLKKEEVIEA